MNDGDIIAELRAWRDEFARSHGYDLRAVVAALSKLDSAAGRQVVRGEPRCPEAMLPTGASTANEFLQQIGHANDGCLDSDVTPA